MWIFHSWYDATAKGNNVRHFPFQTKVTDKELYFKGYGSGLKTAATVTILTYTIAHGTGNVYNLNNWHDAGSGNSFKLATTGADTYTAKAGEGSQPTGMVLFKFGNGKWGGDCCKVAGCDALTGATDYKQCNLASGTLLLFAANENNQIAHQVVSGKTGTDELEALTQVTYNAVMDMPAYYTTVRGRGGMGASN